MAWLEIFKEHVSPAEFFARFIERFNSSRKQNYQCLFHPDADPSMSVDPRDGVFHCHGCGADGGLLDFFARLRGFDLTKPDERRRCIEAMFHEFGLDPPAANEIAAASHGSGDKARTPKKAKSVTPEPPLIADAIVAEMVDALWSSSGERARRYLIEERGLTEETLRKFEIGWSAERHRIAIPVRDEAGRAMNIRLFSPTSSDKIVSFAKGYGGARLYPLSALETATAPVLAEGEIDALALIQLGIPAVTATGGAKIDWAKNPQLCTPFRGKDVIVLYDRGATEPGVAAAREIAPVLLDAGAASVKIASWPDDALAACGGAKVDVNDFVMKAMAGVEKFRVILDGAEVFKRPDEPPPPSDAASGAQVATPSDANSPGESATTSNGTTSPDDHALMNALWDLYFVEKKAGVSALKGVSIAQKAEAVIDHIADGGTRFFYFANGADAVFVKDGRSHVVFPDDEPFKRFWHKQVRLFGMQTANGRELIEALGAAIMLRRDCVRVARSRWGHIDWDTGAVYLCIDPAQAVIVRVRPSLDGKPIVEELPNGTDGVLLRCATFREKPFHYVPGDMFDAIARFRDLVHRQQALDEVDRLASTAFNLAALFPELDQRPLKFHQGGEHSGKTSAAQDFEVVVYGEKRAGGFNRHEEFWSALDAAGPIVCQDNAETKVRAKFGEAYNKLTTGVAQRFRKLYTNGVVVTYYPNASLVLTAIESFTQPEDIDRAIEFNFDVAHHDLSKRLPRTEHLRQIAAHGDVMLSAILDVMSVAVLPGLADGIRRAEAFINEKRPRHPKARFNEFLALVFVWFEAMGDLLWDEARAGEAFEPEKHFLEFLDRQRNLHIQNAVAASREVQFLDAIRLGMGARSSFDGPSLPGLPVAAKKDGTCTIGPSTTGVLFTAFGMIAKATGARMPWDGPRQLGQRMAAAARPGHALEEAHWERKASGTAHSNNPMFEFIWTPIMHSVKDESAPPKGDSPKGNDGGGEGEMSEWLAGGKVKP